MTLPIVFWTPGAWQPDPDGMSATFASINMSDYEQTIRNTIDAPGELAG